MVRMASLSAALLILTCFPAAAELNGTLRIGVLNDMSSVYADFQGPGSVTAAQLAVEDFAKQSKRKAWRRERAHLRVRARVAGKIGRAHV